MILTSTIVDLASSTVMNYWCWQRHQKAMLNMKIIDLEVDAGLLNASMAASILRCSNAVVQQCKQYWHSFQ